jgi:MarR family
MQNQHPLTDIVNQFLEQWCYQGMGYHAPDRPLCSRFRAFWARMTNEIAPPALLEEFRAELVQRGYQLATGKHPCWEGLSLRGRWNKPGSSILPARQCAMLLLFARRDQWSIVELARELTCSVPTASRTVDRLQRQGALLCVTATEDRRRVQVRLTAYGQELLNALPQP